MKSFNLKFKQIGWSLMLGIGAISLGSALAPQSASAQERDPFRKPVIAVPRPKGGSGIPKQKPVPPPVTVVAAPPIEKRIENYKLLRIRAAEMGVPAPKPTSVLTLDEIEVTGIFRTPRGYAAMVEATPLKLSYTVYPGEQFYNGQLVAIEDNRTVFRRTTQWTNGKSVDSAENKALKVPGINDMLLPRTESATNSAQPVINPTTTIPATSVPAASSETVQTADSKPASETEPAAFQPAAKPKPANNAPKRVQPRRKSGSSSAGSGKVAPKTINY